MLLPYDLMVPSENFQGSTDCVEWVFDSVEVTLTHFSHRETRKESTR